jgi:hypothetical protein
MTLYAVTYAKDSPGEIVKIEATTPIEWWERQYMHAAERGMVDVFEAGALEVIKHCEACDKPFRVPAKAEGRFAENVIRRLCTPCRTNHGRKECTGHGDYVCHAKVPERAWRPSVIISRNGRPYRCRECTRASGVWAQAMRARMAAMTPEQRSEARRKAWANMTPERRSEVARTQQAAMTPEQRSEARRKAWANMTPERRSEAARKREAAMTPEQRSEVARKRQAAMTPEQRSEAARKAWATKRNST